MRVLLLAIAVLLPACAPEPEGAPAPRTAAVGRDVAEVCVLRPEPTASTTTFQVRDNGRLVGATRGESYFCYLAATGRHQITGDDDTGPLLVTARPGARIFVHQEVSPLGGLADGAHAHLDLVDESTAREMLEACTTRVRLAVPGRSDDAVPVAAAR